MYFGNCDCLFDHFLDNLLCCNDLLNNWLNWDYLLSFDNNFFYLFTNIGYFLNYFFYFLINNNFLLNFDNLLNSNLFGSLSNNLFNNLWDLNDLFNDFSCRDYSLNNLFNWNWNLYRDYDLSFDFHWFNNFNSIQDNLLHFNSSWYLLNNLNDLFNNDFIVDNFFLISWNLN